MQKTRVACETCEVSESFYSNLSVEQFKSRHGGHDIHGGSDERAAPPRAPDAGPAPKEEKPLEGESATKLSKVRVDLVVFPALADPVLRVRGFKDDLEEAFVTTSGIEHCAEVREMLAKGEYVDHDVRGLRFVWEPPAIDYERDARLRLGLPPEEANVTTTVGPELEPRESLRNLDVPPPRSPPEPELMELQARRPKSEEKIEERKDAESASKEVGAPSGDETDDSSLLVSKSWYIQGGTGNRKEAARISRVLKAFRWKVEPLYTIGVILDDLLSVETSKNQISRALIASIEGTGYRLTAVSIDQGKPVAWFKKAAPGPKESEGDEPGASSLDEVGDELEAGVAG